MENIDIHERLATIERLLLTLVELAGKQAEIAPELTKLVSSVSDQMRALNAEMILIKERLAGAPPVQH